MFCALVLAEDAKNYHVWSHRQHVVRACSLWQHELAFTATAIAADVRNNSAWNQRMFCLLGEAQGGPLPVAVVDRELAFARVYTLCAPNNEAAWAYVGGLAAHAAVVDGAPGRVASLATDGRYHALVEEVCCVTAAAVSYSEYQPLPRLWRSTRTAFLPTRCLLRCMGRKHRCLALLGTQPGLQRHVCMQQRCCSACRSSTHFAATGGRPKFDRRLFAWLLSHPYRL